MLAALADALAATMEKYGIVKETIAVVSDNPAANIKARDLLLQKPGFAHIIPLR
jgi:hypothetical protein